MMPRPTRGQPLIAGFRSNAGPPPIASSRVRSVPSDTGCSPSSGTCVAGAPPRTSVPIRASACLLQQESATQGRVGKDQVRLGTSKELVWGLSRACFCWRADPLVDHLPDLLVQLVLLPDAVRGAQQ